MESLFTNSTIRNVNRNLNTIFILIFFTFVSGLVLAQTSTIWSEDWEGNWTNDWHVDAGTWEVGVPTSGPNSAYNGQNCAATVLDGNYSEPVDSRLIRHISFIVPSADEHPRLRFWHWYSFSSGDYGEVQLSTDNGASWETISPTYINTCSSVWTYPLIDLSSYAGLNIQIAFYFHSQRIGSFANVSSGWYIDDVAVVTGLQVFNSLEKFESGIGDWKTDLGTWEVGETNYGPGSAYSGQKCLATVLNGNYAEPVDSRFISPLFTVPSVNENPRLRFWHWYSFSSGDYGEVQLSTDNGASWETISPTYINTCSSVWTYPLIDLSSYAGLNIQIAFYFHSQRIGSFANVSSGWYIDDVAILTGDFEFNNPESFESGFGDWYVDMGTWEIGEPNYGPGSAFNRNNCAATVLDGNYAEPVDSKLISPPFVVSYENPALRFWHWYSFSSGDFGIVQIRVDNGLWEATQNTFTATSSNTWTNYYIPLSDYSGSIIQIAFYFHSERIGSFGNVSSGWYIDSLYIEGIVGVETSQINSTPDNYTLFQNFPNPFNPTTKISYSIPKAGKVNLKVFDMLGREVTTLENEEKPAGNYEITFNASDLPSGVYFYRLKAGSFTESKKLILLR